MGEFAEGLKAFFTKGALVVPVRLNKRMKEIIFSMIKESLENTSVMFKDEQDSYERFMNSMTWLKQKLTKEKIHNIKLNKKIGWTVTMWIWDNRHHHLSGDPQFDKAMQWIFNIINKKYAKGELAI